MTSRGFVSAFLSAAFLLLATAAAHAFVRTTTRSSNPPCPGSDAKPLYWSAVTVPFVIDMAGSPDVTGESAFDAVQTSFNQWQELTCPSAAANTYLKFLNRGKVENAPVGYVRDGANTNVVKWIESGWTQSARAIAVTLTTYDCNTGEIFDADITLNGQFFQFATEPRVGLLRADVANTVTHEVGHFIGFDHEPDTNATMYADAPLGETKKRSLEATDVEGACAVYPQATKPKCSTAEGLPGTCGSRGGGCAVSGGIGAPDSLAAWLVITLLAHMTTRRAKRRRRA